MDRTRFRKSFLAFCVPLIFVLGFKVGALGADEVKVCYIPVTSVSPLFLAIENGHFKREGIDLKLKIVWPTDIRIKSVIGGSMDLCTLGFGAAVVTAVQQGAPIRVVSDLAQQKKGWVYVYWVARKDLLEKGTVKGYKDFKGRSIAMGTLRGSIDDYILARALRRVGLTRADVNLKKVRYGQMAAALKSKALDIAYMLEPFKTIALAQGSGAVLAESIEVAPEGTQQAVMIGNLDFITKRAGVGKRFMKAYLDGARDHVAAFEQGKQERVFEVIDKWTKVKKAMASRLGYAYVSPDGKLNEKASMSQLNYLHSIGVIKKKVNALTEIADYSLLAP